MHRVKAGFWTLMALALALTATGWMAPAQASSHREAPLITEMPKVDGTDFYMFRSYETGRANYVTFLANYIPIQAPYGGPNFFELDPDARYQINIENDGTDGDDLVFEFQFYEVFKDQQLTSAACSVAHPLRTVNPIPFANNSNDPCIYTVNVIRDGVRSAVINGLTNGIFFAKAFDNAGSKTIADYAGYANNLIYPISIPGCDRPGQGVRRAAQGVVRGQPRRGVRPGQRPQPDRSAGRQGQRARRRQHHHARDRSADRLPHRGQRRGRRPHHRVAAAQPPAPRRSGRHRATLESGDLVQVSRLGMPLVNEIVIGLRDKNKFNASQPADDLANFATYVTNPTLPEILEILFGAAGCRLPTTSRAPTWWRRSSPA